MLFSRSNNIFNYGTNNKNIFFLLTFNKFITIYIHNILFYFFFITFFFILLIYSVDESTKKIIIFFLVFEKLFIL